ncbi:Pimeloyl-ACP methyl ester carboxylesterase [Nitrosomonas cryotolerans]|uniref:Pimeloyl-ACP methyl ester carboxylesterase n=1 Tax=Nitrosomonas cryotolerans ATCC 49181 TaxID=1131553 RepID=A0A1N6JA26_9PROT|nr:alpha/beta fold hydrolase [Nitrosomonas cryotolerans]SFQ02829.1 Pimeloyl-ACP methyl ester carboxylesterase [Nitrosomonas cryotolerans]SIO41132.1 Pimeloyl-ACP methyl ester carboxylesterase [Nitrosomonas cryotolerans ATCC 49181]
MPRKKINGTMLHYEESGTGPETVIFAHGLLWNNRLFDSQVAMLKDHFRCITFDFRGQGQSAVAESGYDMDTLTDDVVALIESTNSFPCHFIGLSMGGMIGMRLAIRHPELLKSLVLIGTSADSEPKENLGRYARLNFIARWFGFGLIAKQVMPIMFGQKFLKDPARIQQRNEWHQHLMANHRMGATRAVKGVIARAAVYEQLDRITIPTLIMVGDQDVATSLVKSERMHARIQGSQLRIISGAGHTATIEEPESINIALKTFLLG